MVKTAVSTILLVLCLACASAPQRDEPDPETITRAIAAAASGRSEQAAKLADEAARDCGSGKAGFACELAARIVLTSQFSAVGNSQLALSQARAAVELAERHGDAIPLVTTLSILASGAAGAGELEEADRAVARAEATLDSFEREASPEDRASIQPLRATLDGPRAQILYRKGEPAAAARSQARFVETIRERQPNHPSLAIEWLNLAEMYRAASDRENAVSACQSAVVAASEVGNAELEREARAVLASLTATD